MSRAKYGFPAMSVVENTEEAGLELEGEKEEAERKRERRRKEVR